MVLGRSCKARIPGAAPEVPPPPRYGGGQPPMVAAVALVHASRLGRPRRAAAMPREAQEAGRRPAAASAGHGAPPLAPTGAAGPPQREQHPGSWAPATAPVPTVGVIFLFFCNVLCSFRFLFFSLALSRPSLAKSRPSLFRCERNTRSPPKS